MILEQLTFHNIDTNKETDDQVAVKLTTPISSHLIAVLLHY